MMMDVVAVCGGGEERTRIRVRRALGLQISEPAAATSVWQRVDCQDKHKLTVNPPCQSRARGTRSFPGASLHRASPKYWPLESVSPLSLLSSACHPRRRGLDGQM